MPKKWAGHKSVLIYWLRCALTEWVEYLPKTVGITLKKAFFRHMILRRRDSRQSSNFRLRGPALKNWNFTEKHNKFANFVFKSIIKVHIMISTNLRSSTLKDTEIDHLFTSFSIMALKGQLISKCPFGVFKSPNKPTKFFPGFLP